jgi:hypothetical protein
MMNPRWSQLPVVAAGSPFKDRGLDGALTNSLLPRARARTKHWVSGSASTDRRLLEASASAHKQAASNQYVTLLTKGAT